MVRVRGRVGGLAAVSAGLLLFRREPDGVRVLLVHPGGPFWHRKDLGAWTIPKGEVMEGEPLLDGARREFGEETGWAAPGEAIPLGQVRQPGGKVVHAWAVEGDADPATLRSNTFEIEWPRGSGTRCTFPEVDRAAWFDPAEAGRRILPGQRPLLDVLQRVLGDRESV
ncbi:MAG TPA: NUDIX domain-containing protein [Vicinamibacterales bacterium]|nr:NUDIX domain-containing protein [Vicinamibacterales bacterium]